MPSKQAKKILIVEDEASLLSALSAKFAKEKFEVFEACNGKEGLKVAFEKHPDLILLDIMMPKMNGMTVLKNLREDKWGRNVPVIILTNLSEVPQVIDSLEYDTIELKRRFRKSLTSEKAVRDYVKKYLGARLKKGIDDFVLKANSKLEDLVKKVKLKLKDS